MIDPVLPAGVIQALTGKAERPPIAISVVSLPTAQTAPAQPREIGGTVTQASANGSAILHTAVGDIGIKAPVVLAPGRTATLLLTLTPGGLTAALQVNGPAPPPVQALELPQGAAPNPPAPTGNPSIGSAQVPSTPIRPNTATPQTGGRPIGDQTSPSAVPSRNVPGVHPLPPRPVPLPAGEQSHQNIAAPLPHGFSPASTPTPRLQANPGLRDAALLLSQLAVQLIDQPLPPAATVTTLPDTAEGKAAPAPAATFAAAPIAIPSTDSRPLPAAPASLLMGLAAALKRPPSRADDETRERNANDDDSATPGEAVYRSSGKLSEASENISWRQFQVMDDSRIVPVFLGRHPPEERPEETPDQSSDREPPARFTVRFDLQHAGSVRIDSVYRERRLDMLLTLDTAPDKEMQTALRERLAALSDEFGLSISLRIGGLDSGPR
jgi:hypothetical protein